LREPLALEKSPNYLFLRRQTIDPLPGFDVKAALFSSTIGLATRQSGFVPMQRRPCTQTIGLCTQTLMTVRPNKADLFLCFAVSASKQNAFALLQSGFVS
jgi:hypothetical protein